MQVAALDVPCSTQLVSLDGSSLFRFRGRWHFADHIRADFRADIVVLGGMISRDGGGLVDVAGLDKDQCNNWPRPVTLFGRDDTWPSDIVFEPARIQRMPGMVVLRGPRDDGLLAKRLFFFRQRDGTLPENDHVGIAFRRPRSGSAVGVCREGREPEREEKQR